MQHCSLIRQILERRQHPSNLVSVDSESLQQSAQATLVERYVVDCIQGREGNPLLLVTSQPGFDLRVCGSDICVGDHHLALKCISKTGNYHGGRFVFDKRDQPLLAKQGPDTYAVETEVKPDFVATFPYETWSVSPGMLSTRCQQLQVARPA